MANKFCTCHDSEKHGQTSVMCCNKCGLPDEEFWHNPSLQTPSNEKYWRERCEAAELLLSKINTGRPGIIFVGVNEAREKWQQLKSTPIPILTPCVCESRVKELEEELRKVRCWADFDFWAERNYSHNDYSNTYHKMKDGQTQPFTRELTYIDLRTEYAKLNNLWCHYPLNQISKPLPSLDGG